MAATVSNPRRDADRGTAQPPTVADHIAVDLPGPLGADYVAERGLGRGPVGGSVLARAVGSDRPVVVKLLAGDLADEAHRARFLRAAERAMRLSHPNVLRVFEAAVDPQPYVVTEHVDGETLAEWLARGRRLTAADTTSLAIHLAAGLAHAHANGVVHGALDPHAILLGADGVARITDFGLARLLGPATAPSDTRGSGPAGDVFDLAGVLRQAAGEPLPPGLNALVDAALAQPSVRPSVFDLFHRMHTITSPPGAWVSHPEATPASAT